MGNSGLIGMVLAPPQPRNALNATTIWESQLMRLSSQGGISAEQTALLARAPDKSFLSRGRAPIVGRPAPGHGLFILSLPAPPFRCWG